MVGLHRENYTMADDGKKTSFTQISETLSQDTRGVFSDTTKTNLQKLSSQLEKLKDLENNPIQYFLEFFPAAFAMLDEDLRYILHSTKWTTSLNLSRKDLTGALLEFSGFHVAYTSIEVYKKALRGEYHTDRGKDVFMTKDNKRVHIHWMVWKKDEGPAGILLIANLNALHGPDPFHS